MPEGGKIWDGKPSAFVELIKQPYAELQKAWTNHRVHRLCELIDCTYPEICAMVGIIRNADVNRLMQGYKWNVTRVLHLQRIEDFVVKAKMGAVPSIRPDDALLSKFLNRSKEGEVIQ